MKHLQLRIVTLILTLLIFFLNNLIAQTLWQRYEGNPVIEPIQGTWEDKFYGDGGISVIYDEIDKIYKMWYTGYVENTYTYRIGLATSTDGFNWIRHSNNPLDLPTDPMLVTTRNQTVIFDSNKNIYHIWYRVTLFEPEEHYAICYSTSLDGINWSDSLNVVLEPREGKWDSAYVGYPTVVLHNDTLKMWYLGGGIISFEHLKFAYAYSQDGVHWEGRIPISGVDSLAFFPSVITDGDTLRMFYNSMVDSGINYAWSIDGTDWNDYELNPVFGAGNESWDNPAIHSVIKQGNNYKMWYVGNQDMQATTSGIGLATAFMNTLTPKSAFGLIGKWAEPILVMGIGWLADTSQAISSYNVYRKISNQEFHLLNDEPILTSLFLDTTFNANSNDLHQYYVTSVDVNQYESAPSNIIKCIPSDINYDNRVTELNPDNEENVSLKPTFSWSAKDSAVTYFIMLQEGGDSYEYPVVWGYRDSSTTFTFKQTDGLTYIDEVGETLRPNTYYHWQIYAINIDNVVFAWNKAFFTTTDSVTSIQNNEILIESYNLFQNYPNPFNPTTTISFYLQVPSIVNLSIHNLSGKLIKEIVNEYKNSGYHEVLLNAKDFSSGIYFYRIEAGEFSETKKCLILK